jgi:hypothetical protein
VIDAAQSGDRGADAAPIQVATEVAGSRQRFICSKRWSPCFLVPTVVSDHRFVTPDRRYGIPERPNQMTKVPVLRISSPIGHSSPSTLVYGLGLTRTSTTPETAGVADSWRRSSRQA